MRLAVVYAGEYRTFEYCRPTHSFLDQYDLDVEVYFVTWDRTKEVNPHPVPASVFGDSPVTIERILQALGRPASVHIHDPAICTRKDGNWAMRTMWSLARTAVQQSGRNYDHVLMLRPDLYFQQPAQIVPELIASGRTLAVRKVPVNGSLEDTVFFLRSSDYLELFSDLFVDQLSKEWHESWYQYVIEQKFQLATLPLDNFNCIINRFPASHSETWQDVFEKFYEIFRARITQSG